MHAKEIKRFAYRMLCGFLLGTTIIAPGVSSSIMAVIMGIYNDLIEIVSAPFKNFKKNVIYLIPLGIGAVISMLTLIQAFNWLFKAYPAPAYMLFIGLMIGSLPAVFNEALLNGFKKRYLIGLAVAFAIALTVGLLSKNGVSFTENTSSLWYFSLSGAIAGTSSMVPGMSISMILMLLGVYESMLDATAAFDVLTMAPVFICFVIGMILFSNITKRVFKKFHGFGYFMVMGFMSGSIIGVFLSIPHLNDHIILSVLTLLSGLFISFLFQRIGKKLNVSGNSVTAQN